MEYSESIKRCKNIMCVECGRFLRPIKNDKEKRFLHLICEEIRMAKINSYNKIKLI
jgi:hypothetical protein